MKTLSEIKQQLQEEIDRHLKQGIGIEILKAKLEGITLAEKSLSRQIEQDVAGCSEFVNLIDPEHDVARCHYVPPVQKCEGCRRLLKFKESL